MLFLYCKLAEIIKQIIMKVLLNYRKTYSSKPEYHEVKVLADLKDEVLIQRDCGLQQNIDKRELYFEL